MKVFVTRLGSHGHDASARDENTNAASPRWRLFEVARASARRRCATSRRIVEESMATR
jgi:hypothetical protein